MSHEDSHLGPPGDRGRVVMYGGNAYEDDLEPADLEVLDPDPDAEAVAQGSAGGSGKTDFNGAGP
jgi:hypothetical protein